MKTFRDKITGRVASTLIRLSRAIRLVYISFSAVFVMALSSGVITSRAETVSQKEAKDYATRFFNEVYKDGAAPIKLVYNGKRLTTDRLFTPFYVYNHPRGGFVIISAENKTYPIMAYSLKDNFSPDNLGETETAMLRNYATDIEYIRYDSRVPEEAIKAWGDFDNYVNKMLAERYEATTPTISEDDAVDTLNMLWTTDAGLDSYADLYTPQQWQDMVDNELRLNGSAALGYIDSKGLHPATVYGKKGDYYRIRLDGCNNWFARLMASELLSDRQLLSTLSPTYKAPLPTEEAPFAFYDEFTRSLESERQRADEMQLLANAKPIVKAIGGGHYDIVLPEDVSLAMIYNLNGSHIGRRTYKSTNVAHIDIEAEPTGFYFVFILAESGNTYGLKITR